MTAVREDLLEADNAVLTRDAKQVRERSQSAQKSRRLLQEAGEDINDISGRNRPRSRVPSQSLSSTSSKEVVISERQTCHHRCHHDDSQYNAERGLTSSTYVRSRTKRRITRRRQTRLLRLAMVSLYRAMTSNDFGSNKISAVPDDDTDSQFRQAMEVSGISATNSQHGPAISEQEIYVTE